MSLYSLAEAYEQLLPSEQGLFEAVIQRLLAEGFIWREDDRGTHLYDFLERHQTHIDGYLSLAGWEVRHHQQCRIFHLTHREGHNRHHFTLEQTRLLLLLRLIYAQQQEQHSTDSSHLLSRYPVATISDIFQMYIEIYGIKPGKSDFQDGIQRLQRLKLVRIHWTGGQQKDMSEADLELLPVLEVIFPNETIAMLESRISNYRKREANNTTGEDYAEKL